MIVVTPMPKKSSAMVVNYISAAFILLIFIIVFTCEDSAVAFTFVSRVKSSGKSVLATTDNRSKQRQRIYRTDRRQQIFQMNSQASDQHDYSLEANSDPAINEACTFTEDQIHQLIARRLECKKRRNFSDADRILDALHKNGIHLQDKARKYRVDGENHFGRRKHYVQRGASIGLSNLALVEEMVEERARYKRMRDYHRSDEITTTLKEKYGVRVDDRRREWSFVEKRSGGGGQEESTATIECYVPTPLAPKDHPTHTMADEVKEIIRDRLEERSIARKSKDYKTSDRILEKLQEDYSIVVDDRTKEWKVVFSDDSLYDENENDPFAREAKLSRRSAFVQTRREVPFGGNERDINTRWDDRDSNKPYSNRDDRRVDDALSRILGNIEADDDVKEEEKEAEEDDDEDVTNSSPTFVSKDEGLAPRNENPEGVGISAEGVDEETVDSLGSLTVVALKEKLRTAGLPVSGKKSELIDRLLSTSMND